MIRSNDLPWSEHAKLGTLDNGPVLVTWAILSSTYSPAPTEVPCLPTYLPGPLKEFCPCMGYLVALVCIGISE